MDITTLTNSVINVITNVVNAQETPLPVFIVLTNLEILMIPVIVKVGTSKIIQKLV